jgi:hypothetical protein
MFPPQAQHFVPADEDEIQRNVKTPLVRAAAPVSESGIIQDGNSVKSF